MFHAQVGANEGSIFLIVRTEYSMRKLVQMKEVLFSFTDYFSCTCDLVTLSSGNEGVLADPA